MSTRLTKVGFKWNKLKIKVISTTTNFRLHSLIRTWLGFNLAQDIGERQGAALIKTPH
jgi:hypothetical protein